MNGRRHREALAQSSYFSVNDSRLHFGLGESGKADLEVRWLGGRTDRFLGVQANRLVTIREGNGIIRARAFPF